MPIYDLVCADCGFEEEFLSPKMVAETGRQCPSCSVDLKKKISPVMAIFKGPGFYATEHGRSQFNYKGDKKNQEDRDEFIEQARKGSES